MKNEVIKVLNPQHGKKVIDYFRRQGYNVKGYSGDISRSDIFLYYGVINNLFSNYSKKQIERACADIIKLPEDSMSETKESDSDKLPKRGELILCWDEDVNDSEQAIFLTFIKGAMYPIITVDIFKEEIDNFHSGVAFSTTKFKNFKKIKPLVELTLQDIFEGKGVGIDPKLMVIKFPEKE